MSQGPVCMYSLVLMRVHNFETTNISSSMLNNGSVHLSLSRLPRVV